MADYDYVKTLTEAKAAGLGFWNSAVNKFGLYPVSLAAAFALGWILG